MDGALETFHYPKMVLLRETDYHSNMTTVGKIYLFARDVNATIDSSRIDLSFAEMRGILIGGRLFEYLGSNRFRQFDLSYLDEDDRSYFERNLKEMALVGRERHYYGVEKNGLCLLLAFLISLLERSAGSNSKAWDAGEEPNHPR